MNEGCASDFCKEDIQAHQKRRRKEEEFLKAWQEAAEYLRHASGFVSTQLHGSLDPKAKFRFVNVAEWESPQHFQAAIRTEAFQQIGRKMAFTAYPSLYKVVAE